ncbi:MAG: ribose-5-phosphate isomerase RpiA [Acidobacteriota bacterium]|jgi:ribose 5-phosphate isomerase A
MAVRVNHSPTMPDIDQEKQLAAAYSLRFVEDGMAVGLGSGSTASHFISSLGERVRSGLRIRAIATSEKSGDLAREVGIELTDFSQIDRLDVTVDGADEIDPRLNLIKGGGGALLHEKIVASATDRLVIIADSRKPVSTLGAFPLPVEIVPFGYEPAIRRIRELGPEVKLRTLSTGNPFLTAEKNYILDCSFGRIDDLQDLADRLKRIAGVVEHGLFLQMASLAVIARGNEIKVEHR